MAERKAPQQNHTLPVSAAQLPPQTPSAHRRAGQQQGIGQCGFPRTASKAGQQQAALQAPASALKRQAPNRRLYEAISVAVRIPGYKEVQQEVVWGSVDGKRLLKIQGKEPKEEEARNWQFDKVGLRSIQPVLLLLLPLHASASLLAFAWLWSKGAIMCGD